jgi:predicted nucleic acid-binding protein
VNGYLIDTNVVSELTKPVPAPQVEEFLRRTKDSVFVSVFSIGEIRKGIACLPAGNRRAVLEDWLDNEIMPWFADRILPVTLDIAERWGEISAQLKAKGRLRPVVDTVLAATALRHGLVLATRNVRDYADLGIALVNPWDTR